MARRKKTQEQDEQLIDLMKAGEQAQSFFDQYQRPISMVFGGIALAIALFFAYKYLYQQPREAKAAGQLYLAEQRFRQDSFALALQDPGGGAKGFINIIADYSGTKAANMASYYAGICYLNLGDFPNALIYLNDFSPKGEITPIMKYGAMGDAYSETGDFDKALKHYAKASDAADNNFLTPYYLFKLGRLHEKQGNADKALAAYKRIKEEYPSTEQGRNIERYIARLEK